MSMGFNFKGVNPESKAKLEGIVKDGIITKEEMQGLTAAEKEALEKAFGGELPKIGDNFITPSKVEAKPKNEEKPGFFKRAFKWATETTAGKIVTGTLATAAVVGGTIATFGTGTAGIVALLGLGLTAASCTKEENINLTTNVTVSLKSDIEAALKRFEDRQDARDAKLFAILEKIYKGVEDGNNLTQANQTLLKNILNVLNNLKEGQDDIKEPLTKLLELVSDNNKMTSDTMALINTIISKLNDLQNKECDHTSIIEALDKVTEAINKIVKSNEDMSYDVSNLLNKIISLVTAGNEISEGNQKLLNMILEKMDSINGGTSYDSDVKKSLDKIINLIETSIKQNQEIGETNQKQLAQIINLLGGIGSKLDVNFEKLIEAVAKNNVNLDGLTRICEKILKAIDKLDGDMKTNLTAVLNAIANITAGGGDTSAIEALLEKVIDNQDKNTKAIIEAMGKIEFNAGDVNIDLSSIEKMMQELLAQSKKNGNILTDIDAKLDAIKVTGDAILAKINAEAEKGDKRYEKVYNLMQQIFNKLGDSGVKYDDSKLLEILGNLSGMIEGKLNEILEAIKDHDVKVTVDVTGKVTCECNCGKNHECIIGDLNDLMG